MTIRRTVFALGCTGALAAGTAYLMENQFAPQNGAPGVGVAAAEPPAASPLVVAAARSAPQAVPFLSARAASAPPARPSASLPAVETTADPEMADLVFAAAPEVVEEVAEVEPRLASFANILPRAAGLAPSWPGQGGAADFGLAGLVRAGLEVVRDASGGNCTPQLDLAAVPGALIDVTVTAPCHASQRVVLRHAGLAVTVMTDGAGRAETLLPAFEAAGGVIATLSGSAVAVGGVAIPDLDAFERVALQWQGADEFALHAFVGDAGFGEPGHVWSGAPDGQGVGNAFVLGFDGDGVEWPLRAEVLTWLHGDAQPDIEIEAPVTAATCGREMLGEALILQRSGSAIRADTADVAVAMPSCEATGGFVVLRNLIPEPTLSSN